MSLEHEHDRLMNERSRLVLDGVDPGDLTLPLHPGGHAPPSAGSTSAQLRQTQQALAASQADLSEALKQRDLAHAELTSANTELAQLRIQLSTTKGRIHQLENAREELASENIRLGVQIGTLAAELSAYDQPEPL